MKYEGQKNVKEKLSSRLSTLSIILWLKWLPLLKKVQLIIEETKKIHWSREIWSEMVRLFVEKGANEALNAIDGIIEKQIRNQKYLNKADDDNWKKEKLDWIIFNEHAIAMKKLLWWILNNKSIWENQEMIKEMRGHFEEMFLKAMINDNTEIMLEAIHISRNFLDVLDNIHNNPVNSEFPWAYKEAA